MEEVYLRHGKWRTFAVFTEVHLNRNRDVVSSVRSVPRCQQFRPTFCPFLVADMQAFIRSPNAANSFPISLHDSLASWLSSFASQIFCLLVPVSSEFVLLWSIQTKKKLPFEKDFYQQKETHNVKITLKSRTTEILVSHRVFCEGRSRHRKFGRQPTKFDCFLPPPLRTLKIFSSIARKSSQPQFSIPLSI